MEDHTTGDMCTAVGRNALYNSTTPDYNTAVGYNALSTNTTGQYSVAVGSGALQSATTGGKNVAIGHNAGNGQTDAYHCIYIGYDCPDNAGTGYEIIMYNGTQNLRVQGSDTSWAFSSDGRDKTDIEDLTLGLNFINKLKPRKFTWDPRDPKRSAIKGDVRAGFIAQEVQSAVTDLSAEFTRVVKDVNPDSLLVAEAGFIPMMVKAIQELSTKVTALEAA